MTTERNSEKPAADSRHRPRLWRNPREPIVIGLAILLPIVACVGFFLWKVTSIFDPPPQPKFGYTGDWWQHTVGSEEIRPLPPAGAVWQDFRAWKTKKPNAVKYYIARLGHATRQSHFQSWTNKTHNMPLGDYDYTTVEFVYHDPTNGSYQLSWSLPGKHDVRFLRFNDTVRRYQLEFGNRQEEGKLPGLRIVGIEGIEPQYK